MNIKPPPTDTFGFNPPCDDDDERVSLSVSKPAFTKKWARAKLATDFTRGKDNCKPDSIKPVPPSESENWRGPKEFTGKPLKEVGPPIWNRSNKGTADVRLKGTAYPNLSVFVNVKIPDVVQLFCNVNSDLMNRESPPNPEISLTNRIKWPQVGNTELSLVDRFHVCTNEDLIDSPA